MELGGCKFLQSTYMAISRESIDATFQQSTAVRGRDAELVESFSSERIVQMRFI
jgi:hypothetical protein